TIDSCTDSACIVRPPCGPGNDAASRFDTTSSSWLAAVIVAAGARRPTPISDGPGPERSLRPGNSPAGISASQLRNQPPAGTVETSNGDARMPITVIGVPLRVIDDPSAAGSPPNRRCQKACVITTTGVA